MHHKNRNEIQSVAERTRLDYKTCADLFENGWMYIEDIRMAPRWEKVMHK